MNAFFKLYHEKLHVPSTRQTFAIGQQAKYKKITSAGLSLNDKDLKTWKAEHKELMERANYNLEISGELPIEIAYKIYGKCWYKRANMKHKGPKALRSKSDCGFRRS